MPSSVLNLIVHMKKISRRKVTSIIGVISILCSCEEISLSCDMGVLLGDDDYSSALFSSGTLTASCSFQIWTSL